MYVACVGDLHLISDRDPHHALRERRAFFAAGYGSLRRLLDRLNGLKPDLVVFLGDLVDWFSEENVAFAAEFLGRLQVPWQAVPGNHDLAAPQGGSAALHTRMDRRHKRYWRQQGIALDNRYIDAGGFGLCLLDNSLSDVEQDGVAWLAQHLAQQRYNLVCQHVPLDIPQNRAHIHSLAPDRDLARYTCSGNPGLYASHYRGRVQAVCNGHVHIGGRVRSDDCVHHMCPLALTMTDPGRKERTTAEATLLRFDGERFHAEALLAD